MYVNFDYYVKFSVHNGNVHRSIEKNSSCPQQQEADTKTVHRIICHLSTKLNISLLDVLITLFENMKYVKEKKSIFIHVDVGNTHRYIDVTSLYEAMEKKSSALPGLHAFTGCGCNPMFFGKGKKQPFHLLQKSMVYQCAFLKLRDAETCASFAILSQIYLQAVTKKSL